MPKLEPPDHFFFSAAIGWLELNNPAEALVELDQISAENQVQPDVLEVRYQVLAQIQRWDAALETAQALVGAVPHRATAWLHQAYALRRAASGGLQAAWEALLAAQPKFPQDLTIAFNLSCYACQLQQLDVARTWLGRAVKLGGKELIQRMALGDPDLQPLWGEIRQL